MLHIKGLKFDLELFLGGHNDEDSRCNMCYWVGPLGLKSCKQTWVLVKCRGECGLRWTVRLKIRNIVEGSADQWELGGEGAHFFCIVWCASWSLAFLGLPFSMNACFFFERSQRGLHDGTLRHGRPEFFLPARNCVCVFFATVSFLFVWSFFFLFFEPCINTFTSSLCDCLV